MLRSIRASGILFPWRQRTDAVGVEEIDEVQAPVDLIHVEQGTLDAVLQLASSDRGDGPVNNPKETVPPPPRGLADRKLEAFAHLVWHNHVAMALKQPRSRQRRWRVTEAEREVAQQHGDGTAVAGGSECEGDARWGRLLLSSC